MVLRLNFGHAAAIAPPSAREGLDPYPAPKGAWDIKFVRAVQAGMRELTDPGFLVPMVFAQGVFGLSRLALLRLTPRGVSAGLALARANLGAFGLEGLALATSTRGLQHAMGRELVPGASFAKELGHAYLSMGLLKSFGGATHAALHWHYHKIPAPLLSLADKTILNIAPQAAQFGGIYLSHTLAPGLGLGHYIDPAERAFQSAVSLVHFGAAGFLLNRIPGYFQANQKIFQQTQKFGDQLKDYWNDHMALPIRSLAATGIGAMGLGPVRNPALRANEMWMNASNKDGSGKDEPVEVTAIPISDSQPPSGKTLKRDSNSRIDVTMRSAPDEKAPLPDAAPDPLLGQTIEGRYYVEKLLGEGGMGKVYLGKQKQLDKKVAIKVLHNDMAKKETVSQRFLNEAKAVSMINNDHIIDVSNFGQLPDGSPYFVMEFLKGRSLGELTDAGKPLPLFQILNISRQVTEGMAAAHEAGVVHRDLKPDNIYLAQRGSDMEFVKIIDFGIAKVPMDSNLTMAGEIFGSPSYISPEQASGEKVDHRGDIYSLGVILYEMATGRLPFISEHYSDVLNMHITQQPPPPRSLVSNPRAIPSGLEAVILKCLQKKPGQRYQSMNELGTELARVEQGLKPIALTLSIPPLFNNSPNWIKDWRLWAGLSGIALTGAATALLLKKDKEKVESPLPPPSDKKDPVKPTPTPAVKIQELNPLPTSHRVEISVQPIDAQVFLGDEDLGSGKVSLEIPAGDKVGVEVRKRGFKSQKISLDGSELEISVKLKPIRAKVPVATPPPIPKSSSTPKPSRQDDMVRPWN